MLHNSLSSPVVLFVLFYSFFIIIDIRLIFTALYTFAIFCFGTLVFHHTASACAGSVSFEMISSGFVPGAGGSKFIALGTNVIIAILVVAKVFNVVGADRVIKYLGQYTHRVAISNARIQNIDKENVSFFYKDYRDNVKRKLTTLTGVEFLRRFSMHILPKGFVKIRYYGILSNRFCKQTALYRKTKQDRSRETVQQRLKRLTGFDVYQCPYCKKGHMRTIKVLPRIRSPGNFLHQKPIVVKM